MQQRGQTTTFQTRLQISEYATAGLNDPQIATAVGCSVWTVRKWRRRWHKRGRVGMTSHMGRPATGPALVASLTNEQRPFFNCANCILALDRPPF